MPNAPDILLLKRWRDQRDARAFQALTRRYGGLVFGICNRVLKNEGDAQEVTQDCFLKLAQHPSIPERSLGPWLHSVAVRGAIDRRRSEQRRREREAAYEGTRPKTVTYSSTELLEHVDEAIGELPEDLRACVVGHFLEERTQADVGAELGISIRTVRRRTDAAIERVRVSLENRGITSSAGALTGVLASMKAEALPPAIGTALGKIAMGGKAQQGLATNWAVAEKVTHVGGGIAMKKGIAGAIIVALGLSAWWFRGVEPAGPATADVDTPGASTVAAAATPQGAAESPPEPNAAPPATPPVPDASGGKEASTPSLFDVSAYTLKSIENPTDYAAIAGVVLDDVGRAIPKARVTVLASGYDFPTLPADNELVHLSRLHYLDTLYISDGHRYETETNAQGEYAVEGIRYAGHTEVGVTADGFRFSQKSCALEPEQRANVDFRLSEGHVLHARVVTPGKVPVSDAIVHCFSQSTPDGSGSLFNHRLQPFQTKTDRNGNFSFWADPSLGELLSLRVQSRTLGENVFNMVPLGSEERVILTLEPRRATLTGQLRTHDEQAAAAYQIVLRGAVKSYIAEGELRGSGAVAGPFLQAVTDQGGRFTLDSVPTMATYWANVFTRDGKLVLKEELEPLEPGATTTWNRTIGPPTRIAGDVRGTTTDTGIPNIPVVYYSDNTDDDAAVDFGHVRTDDSGAFEINLAAGPGLYHITPGYNETYLVTQKTDETQTLEIRPGDQKTLEFRLPEPWSQALRVVDQFGQPISGIQPHARYVREDGKSRSANIERVTDADGRIFLENLPPYATASLTFKKPGHLDLGDVEFYGTPGEAYPEETAVMYRATSAITRVIDETGAPVTNTPLTCTIQYGDGLSLQTLGQTDADGWLRLENNVPATAVTLAVSAGEAQRTEGQIEGTLELAKMNELGTVTLRPIEEAPVSQ